MEQITTAQVTIITAEDTPQTEASITVARITTTNPIHETATTTTAAAAAAPVHAPSSSSKITFTPPAPKAKPQIVNISCSQLYNIVNDTAVSKLIGDMRSKELFDESHVRTAVPLIPAPPQPQPPPLTSSEDGDSQSTTTTVDASTWMDHFEDLNGIEDPVQLTNELNRIYPLPAFKRRGLLFEKIVLYDESDPSDENTPRKKLARILEKEGKLRFIYLLDGPYSEFARSFPFVITTRGAPAPIGSFPAEIIPNFLYLGSYESAQKLEHLVPLGITHIVNMAGELTNVYPDRFEYFSCQLDDAEHADIAAFFEAGIRFIDNARRHRQGAKVLVHCAMGISRSSAMVIAYLMVRYGWSFERSKEHVRGMRSIIRPNPGFVKQLLQLEYEIMQRRAAEQEQEQEQVQVQVQQNESVVEIKMEVHVPSSSSSPSSSLSHQHHGRHITEDQQQQQQQQQQQ